MSCYFHNMKKCSDVMEANIMLELKVFYTTYTLKNNLKTQQREVCDDFLLSKFSLVKFCYVYISPFQNFNCCIRTTVWDVNVLDNISSIWVPGAWWYHKYCDGYRLFQPSSFSNQFIILRINHVTICTSHHLYILPIYYISYKGW